MVKIIPGKRDGENDFSVPRRGSNRQTNFAVLVTSLSSEGETVLNARWKFLLILQLGGVETVQNVGGQTDGEMAQSVSPFCFSSFPSHLTSLRLVKPGLN